MTKDNKAKKPFYKNWVFWVIVVVAAIFIGIGSSTSNETEPNKQAVKWSEMTLGDRKSLAEDACEETAINTVESNKVDIISLRYSWDSWSSLYGNNWNNISKEVKDGNYIDQTRNTNLPFYNYRWAGNYKEENGKSKVTFDCWFSVDENNNNKIDIIWLNLDGVDLWKTKADLDATFPE